MVRTGAPYSPSSPSARATTNYSSRSSSEIAPIPGRYIENVLEELDSSREWYFDEKLRVLYYKPNASDPSAHDDTGRPAGDFASTNLTRLFHVAGSMEQPVRDVVIDGLVLRDTAYTYFEPHGLPSGGDWALPRIAALTIEGAANVSVSRCLFTRLDGGGAFISGYARNLSVTDNEFSFIGGSALAAWGDTSRCCCGCCCGGCCGGGVAARTRSLGMSSLALTFPLSR